jgi:hypothetical protein
LVLKPIFQFKYERATGPVGLESITLASIPHSLHLLLVGFAPDPSHIMAYWKNSPEEYNINAQKIRESRMRKELNNGECPRWPELLLIEGKYDCFCWS